MFLCLFFHHIIYFILYFSVLSLSLFLSAKKHILILSGIRDTPTNNKESKEGEKLVTPYFTIYMQILSNHCNEITINIFLFISTNDLEAQII